MSIYHNIDSHDDYAVDLLILQCCLCHAWFIIETDNDVNYIQHFESHLAIANGGGTVGDAKSGV